MGHDAAEWDRRYSEHERMWSGQPNAALVAEVAGLACGRALDVGCGEGADAIWLARAGWGVTGLEVSGVALRRAADHATGTEITWLHSGLVEAQLTPRSFDLVCAMYPALPRSPDARAERALLSAVAIGGTLLVVHHALDQTHHNHEDFVSVQMIEARLDNTWRIEVSERRPRVAPEGGAGARAVDDIVLRARRLR